MMCCNSLIKGGIVVSGLSAGDKKIAVVVAVFTQESLQPLHLVNINYHT